jgi:hypothetical protein
MAGSEGTLSGVFFFLFGSTFLFTIKESLPILYELISDLNSPEFLTASGYQLVSGE